MNKRRHLATGWLAGGLLLSGHCFPAEAQSASEAKGATVKASAYYRNPTNAISPGDIIFLRDGRQIKVSAGVLRPPAASVMTDWNVIYSIDHRSAVRQKFEFTLQVVQPIGGAVEVCRAAKCTPAIYVCPFDKALKCTPPKTVGDLAG